MRRALDLAIVGWLVAASVGIAACAPGRGVAAPSELAVATATPMPTPSPTPIPPAATKALAAFERLLDKGRLSYHVKGSGRDVVFDAPERWTIEADVSPSDYGGSVTAGSATVRFASIDGAGWAKAKGRWFRLAVESSAIPDIVRPWAYLCRAESLRYLGPAKSPDGASTFFCEAGYKIQTPRMMHAGLVLTVDELKLTVAADGKPVALSVKGQYPGNASRWADSFSYTLAFTRVGKAVKISGP